MHYLYTHTLTLHDVSNNFIIRATEGTGVELVRPLRGIPRDELMQELTKEGFDIVVSCANYERIKEMKNIDRSREKGEFHTMILDAPFFKKCIQF
jgi:diphthamide synthase (EF-2-diphthine--ammonia ligase)